MIFRRPLACILSATLPLLACSSDADDPVAGGAASASDTEHAGTDTEPPMTDSSASAGADDTSQSSTGGNSQGDNEAPCYADTTVGCTSISWEDIVAAIDALYFFQPSYAGYNKAEALELARELYDNGVPARAYLQIVSAYATDDGFRLHVVVADSQGQPLGDLEAESFALMVNGAASDTPAVVHVLGEADPAAIDLALNVSVVIDDSGSVADCDANFVAQGLELLINNIPPAFSMSLIKFTGTVDLVQEATSDTDALVDALQNECTDRGATALWDALSLGHDVLPHDGGFDATVVFTDGLDNSSETGLSQVIEQHAETGTPVFVLGLGLPDLFSLTNLAAGTNGAFVYVNSGERIVEGFETLTEFIQNSYVIDLPAGPDTLVISVELPSGTVSDQL